MAVHASGISVVTAGFIAEAAASGVAPPVRIAREDMRAWPLLERGDWLLLDEFGDLWWARLHGRAAEIVRKPWPEELTALSDRISRAVGTLRARAAHPAGRARR